MEDLKKFTNSELIIELNSRGLLTSSEYNSQFLNNPTDNFKVILSKGIISENLSCRECKEEKISHEFSFYQARVDRNGYLLRSNALCNDCKISLDRERQLAFQNSEITEKPEPGSLCPRCSRPWSNNWHKHHEGDKFIDWWCGECNMRHADQRNKNI